MDRFRTTSIRASASAHVPDAPPSARARALPQLLRLALAMTLVVSTIAITRLVSDATAQAPPPISIGPFTVTVFPNPGNSGPFDAAQLSNPQFTQVHQIVSFNPSAGTKALYCSNAVPGNESTRPFTAVPMNGDGTCGTVPLAGNGLQAGVASLTNFQLSGVANLTVASAGNHILQFTSDDGWILGISTRVGGTEQPTYVSGALINPTPCSPVQCYPVVGAMNRVQAPTTSQVTVNFPAAGVYPIEIAYTECCSSPLMLVFQQTSGVPIPPTSPPSGPTEQSRGTCNGSGTHANAGTACQHDPVNSLTGAFITNLTDLRLPGIGVPFAWRRSYTSEDPTVGRLGPGWTDSYAISLLVQGNGDVILHGDEGQQVYYTKQGDGSFVGAAGALSTLSSVAGGYQLVRKDQVTYLFNTQGRLTSMKDRNNQGLTFAYDGQGQLQTITDSVGRQIAATFASGLLSRVTLPDGRYVEYSYTAGRLSSVRDTRGGITQYTYDAGGRLKTIVDQNLHTVVDNTYGADGRVTQQVNARGKTGTFAWNPGTQTATYTDARLNQWKDVYSGNLLVERSDPLGNTTRFEYDAGLNVKRVTDARGNATTMTYDAHSNLLTRMAPAPLSYQETWTYNARNDPLTYSDRRGNVTDLSYDAAGNLTSITGPDPDGGGPLARPQTLYGRDPAGTGLLTSLTDPRGKQTTFTYTSGNLTEIRTQLGNRTTMGYDSSGRLTSLVDPRGYAAGASPLDYTWRYSYSAADQLVVQSEPSGPAAQPVVLDYDPAGNLTSRNDVGHTTSYGYDAANNVTSVTEPDPDGGGPLGAPVTQYTYDDVGNRATRRDANLHDTLYEYDSANRLTRVTRPLSRVWSYAYDQNGNATQMVDANGNATMTAGDGQTTYSYDVLNRLTSVDYSDATPDVTFAYDGNDNRTQMTDGSGTETRTYDTLDRLTAVTRGANTFSYAYDLVNLTSRTYPGGASVSYAFDDDERLQSVSHGGLTTTYGYDQAGNLTQTTHPSANGHIETRVYDRDGRLIEVTSQRGATIRSRFQITIGVPNRKPVMVVRTGSLSQTQIYSYDAMERLTGVCFQSQDCVGWTYDGVGNRLTETRPTGTTTYTYNAADELTQAGSTSYTYDQNGNQLSAGGQPFTYDLANRLKTMTQGTTTSTYSYDGDGKRLQTSTGTANSAKTNFLWDVSHSLPQLAQERNGANNLQRQFIYGLRRIRQTQGTGTYYLYDGLGSVANTTAPGGALQKTYSYEPFGAIRTETGSSPTNFFHFTGEYRDPTGLYHLRARQYDAVAGRFLTRDPLAASQMAPYGSSYSYVVNRPTMFVDPTGLVLCEGTRLVFRRFFHSDPPGAVCALEEAGKAIKAPFESAAGVLPPTTGVCADLAGGFGPGGFVEGCYVRTPTGSGYTFSAGMGLQYPGAGIGLSVLGSNAGSVCDLGGPSAYAGGSAGPAVVAIGTDFSASENVAGDKILTTSVGVSAGLPTPLLFELHGGLSGTTTLGCGAK